MSQQAEFKILITRLSHIGDCVQTLPLACAVRDHFPRARVTWVVESPSEQLLAGHEAIDELICLPRGWLKVPRQVWGLRQRLRGSGCDLALDPQSLTKSALVGWLSGARRRIGLTRPLGRELAPWLNRELVTPCRRHVVERSLELLRPLGVLDCRPRFALPRSPEAEQQMAHYLRDAHLGCGFVLINPGAGWLSRRWSPRRFGAVARYLGQHHRLTSVVAWSGRAEKEAAETVISRSGGHALLAPPTDLRQLLALCRRARFYLGADTGPMHLCAAVGTPCVALFGPTLPADSGPYGVLQVPVQAFYQPLDRRNGTQAMQAIEIDMVYRACDELLDRLPEVQADGEAA